MVTTKFQSRLLVSLTIHHTTSQLCLYTICFATSAGKEGSTQPIVNSTTNSGTLVAVNNGSITSNKTVHLEPKGKVTMLLRDCILFVSSNSLCIHNTDF